MISVKKSGKIRTYVVECSCCGCEFHYQEEDTILAGAFVKCPECGADILASRIEVEASESEQVTLFTYYELHNNQNANKIRACSLAQVTKCIPERLPEYSAYIVKRYDYIGTEDGRITEIKSEVVLKQFGKTYEELGDR